MTKQQKKERYELIKQICRRRDCERALRESCKDEVEAINFKNN